MSIPSGETRAAIKTVLLMFQGFFCLFCLFVFSLPELLQSMCWTYYIKDDSELTLWEVYLLIPCKHI